MPDFNITQDIENVIPSNLGVSEPEWLRKKVQQLKGPPLEYWRGA